MLLPAVTGVLKATIDAGDDLEAAELLKDLVELTRTSVGLFRPCIHEIGTAMVSVVNTAGCDEDVRRLATEFLVSLCENAGLQVRKNKTIVEAVIPAALGLMAEFDVADNWASLPYDAEHMGGDQEEDPDSCSAMGAEAMYRLSKTLHGGIMLPVAFAHIPAALKSANPAVRRAAVLAPGLMGEGCFRVMREQLATVLGMVLPALADPDMTVRHAVITTLAFFSADFGVKVRCPAPNTLPSTNVDIADDLALLQSFFQNKYHSRVIPALVGAMHAKSGNPLRLRCHAAQGIVHFAVGNKCSGKVMAKYLDGLLEGTVGLLQSPYVCAELRHLLHVGGV